MSKTPEKDKDSGRFLTGNSGGGRSKGSRNKLGEAFIAALYDDFQAHGVEAIEAVRLQKPDQYLKVIAAILPRDINLNISPIAAMSDAELIERIRALDETIQPYLSEMETGEDVTEPDDFQSAQFQRTH